MIRPPSSTLLSIPGFSDPVSSLTHLAGAVVFAILGFFLIRRGRGKWRRVVSLSVFVVSCVLLLSLSGTYHLLSPDTTGREVLQRLDHGAIFVLIAGSFTPIHVILFHGPWYRDLLVWIWVLAIAGLTVTIAYFNSMPEWLALAMYLGLGWLGVISTVSIARRFGWRVILLLVWGALAYTIGALADFLLWPTLIEGVVHPHELFHFAVLAGIACHWAFIRRIADGRNAIFLDPQVTVLHILAGGERG